MTIEDVVGKYERGITPLDIFDHLSELNAETLKQTLRALPYAQFLETNYWVAVATVAKARAGNRCQFCNKGAQLNAHHRTYTNHGSEHVHMEDLTVLCSACHKKFHETTPQKIAKHTPVFRHHKPKPPPPKAIRNATKLRNAIQNVTDGNILMTPKIVGIIGRIGPTKAVLKAVGLEWCCDWKHQLRGRVVPVDMYRDMVNEIHDHLENRSRLYAQQ